MREIKFRGKRPFIGGWIYGLLDIQANDVEIFSRDNDTFKKGIIIPETIGQFTGLYDKNGKEIYENDLILIKPKPMSKGYVGKVLYVNATFEVEAKEFLHKEYRRLSYYINNPFLVEVIGNVHENSNLL